LKARSLGRNGWRLRPNDVQLEEGQALVVGHAQHPVLPVPKSVGTVTNVPCGKLQRLALGSGQISEFEALLVALIVEMKVELRHCDPRHTRERIASLSHRKPVQMLSDRH
jgi:hypothetical protein